MITNYQNYISGWIGFTFALISFILSFVTLIIIYEMCRETESSKKGSVNIVLRNSETQNPAHAQNERALSVEPYLASDAQKTDFNSATTISRGRSKSGHTKFNGYLLIILSMTCCQILYDLNYMIGITSTYDGCVAWHFLDFLGGLSVPLWTNILSFIVYYIVTYIKSLDIFGNYPFFFFIAVVLPLVFSILTVSMANVIVPTDDEYGCGSGGAYYIFSDIYYWGRVASIGLNLVVFAIISVKLRKMAINEGAGSNHSAAIFALVRRMKYYPIAQLLTRSGAAWNEYNDYQYQTFASQLVSDVTSPSTGAVYFFLFLYMQPRAYSVFCRILRRVFCCLGKEINVSEDIGSFYLRSDSCSGMDDLDEDELECLIESSSAARLTSTASTAPHLRQPSFSVAVGQSYAPDWGISLSESSRSEQSFST